MLVKIPIKDDLLKAYLGGLFETNDGIFLATETTLTGIAICSLAQASCQPQLFNDLDQPHLVSFKLPSSKGNDGFRNKFITLSPSAAHKVNCSLRREFETNYLLFIVRCKMLGMQLKDAIELFIVENNMENYFQGSIDTLSKRYYRFEVKNIELMKKKLVKLAYYKLYTAVSSQNIHK